MITYGPWRSWFAWRPVRQYFNSEDRGYAWLRRVARRQWSAADRLLGGYEYKPWAEHVRDELTGLASHGLGVPRVGRSLVVYDRYGNPLPGVYQRVA